MLTLGIETSCDETSAAVTDGKKILSNKVSSSVHLFFKYGGVIPEMASRYHVEYINQVLKSALADAGAALRDIELIAVTQGPGLPGALLVGVSLAKAISYGLNIPLIGVNHLIGHLYVNLLQDDSIRFPFIGLVISGGHTAIYLVRDVDDYKLLGQTQDDAVGESFDKVAKILGLGYPGGPIIEKMAEGKNGGSIKFPRPRLARGSLDFSFSGIKTSVLYYVRDNLEKLSNPAEKEAMIADISASFQEAVADVISEKTVHACVKRGARQLVVGGGVSCNARLRERLTEKAAEFDITAHFSPKKYCLDNAAMTAGLGEALYEKGYSSDLSMTAVPGM